MQALAASVCGGSGLLAGVVANPPVRLGRAFPGQQADDLAVRAGGLLILSVYHVGHQRVGSSRSLAGGRLDTATSGILSRGDSGMSLPANEAPVGVAPFGQLAQQRDGLDREYGDQRLHQRSHARAEYPYPQRAARSPVPSD